MDTPKATLKAVLGQIDAYARGDCALEDLQALLGAAESVVTSHDERDLRKQLREAESQLELLRFTRGETVSEVVESLAPLKALIGEILAG